MGMCQMPDTGIYAGCGKTGVKWRKMMEIPYLNLQRIHQPLKEQFDDVYNEIMRKEWFIQGEFNRKFEQDYAEYCGTRHCIGVGNGLDAIRIILMALEIGAGDEVIVPANTFIATALAVSYTGATPIFVDADAETYLINYDLVEKAITNRTKAIIGVHLYGRVVDFNKLVKWKQQYGIALIEDAAQAHGGEMHGKRVGALGDAAAFSFYPGKNLGALGDGGAITTNSDVIARKVRAIANYGSFEKYNHQFKGCNSRLDELQAGFLLKKLSHLDRWNEERRNIAKCYQNKVNNPRLRLPGWNGGRNHVFHIYPVMCDNQEAFSNYMRARGIGINIHYPIPICEQGAYREYIELSSKYPITQEICAHEVSIPLYPGLLQDEIEYIIECMNEYQG